MSRLPEVIGVQLVTAEALALLRYKGPGSAHPDMKILLASLVFDESGAGVAVLRDRSLQGWCGRSPGEYASRGFVRSRIAVLEEAGLLAPGSSPGELRSMIGRRAVVVEVEEAVA